MAVESAGPSADSALLFTFDEPDFNPESTTDDNTRLSEIWSSSDNLRRLLERQGDPNEDDRKKLKGALVYQLNTLVLYWQMGVFLRALRNRETTAKTISLYILLFPGEAKDNTGIKDLNDKVIGQWWNAEYIRQRFKAIESIFGSADIFESGDKEFMVAAQTYKTAYIITYEKTRKDFVKKLGELDKKLAEILLMILVKVEKEVDEKQKEEKDKKKKDEYKKQLKEIRTLRKKLNKKGYKFDIFFGFKTLKPSRSSKLEEVYLLVTEALKGAAIARYVAKMKTLKMKPAQKFARGIEPDNRRLDARGKEYDWRVYMKASDMAEKIKGLFVHGYMEGYFIREIYIDTVWTSTFIKSKNLHWGNPDVIRDVRKKKLEQPQMGKGNMTYSLPLQKDLLELWLVVLNMLDFVKRFKFDEFKKELLALS